MIAPKPIFVRVADAKAVFGIGRSTVYEMVKRKEITIHKRGKTALLKVEEVERAIEGGDEDIEP
jgi:excisionase family DNA binding protein